MDNKAMNWFATADFKEYVNKYIAIVDQSVVSSGEDPEEVYNKAEKEYPNKEIILWKVPRKDFLVFFISNNI
ncbi:MAG: DUF5678 domain-containing protein [Methanosarcinales archaeon]